MMMKMVRKTKTGNSSNNQNKKYGSSNFLVLLDHGYEKTQLESVVQQY